MHVASWRRGPSPAVLKENALKRWEYRNIHLLLAPVYLRMSVWCLRHRVTPFGLLKAAYALDHGGATFVSKHGIQLAFPQHAFPPTLLLRKSDGAGKKFDTLNEFAARHDFPIIVKPDVGRVGFGVTLLHNREHIERFLAAVDADYIVQQYVEGPLEFGVFYVKKSGVADIFGINSKEFPSVVGDGGRSVRELLQRHEKLCRFEDLFNKSRYGHVPQAGEVVQLSVIGSHTLGCVFRDATYLKTDDLIAAVDRAVGVPGFNYGRLDVRTSSIEAFREGDFKVIEVNGVESLATNAFDPDFSYRQGLGWFVRQFRLLVEIAAENRHAQMKRLSLAEFLRRVVHAERGINKVGSLLHFAPVDIRDGE